VADGRHGVLFCDQTVEALADAIECFEAMTFDESALRAHRFYREVIRIIGRVAAAEPVPTGRPRRVDRTAHSA
jgi:hypothetical protein